MKWPGDALSTNNRIIGSIWLLFGVLGLALSVNECLRLVQMDEPLANGAIVSTFISVRPHKRNAA